MLHRRDRHRHGRGVLIYTAESLIVSLLPNSVYDQSLEFFLVFTHLSDFQFDQTFVSPCFIDHLIPLPVFSIVFRSLELFGISQYRN